MSASTQTMSVLTCDQCGLSVNSQEASVEGTMSLRIWASQHGWKYVQAMVPVPPEGQVNRKAVRRSWDFCAACATPPELHTTIEVYDRSTRKSEVLPVTLVGGLVAVSYGDSE